ncbi:hypothetical protein [Roseivirga pacifica]|uniref:hypothetical protein n=1 Tax=Roseivirga pacifica TaxID=1267423 RepID=UPI002094C0C3|nr:hypothetical protein [Roseivirga pacifica]MCO6358781.1 hypothetical protein [Roseivirga pacifica]MCO6365583.1 hypothetical protein [Roseivirga pacifica]MCO6371687.1 hypothetical protein [Roseivirga pacifica]MCO6376202.1 hypothetical protein [Roseivirga pacifica]MCO6379065.1 hypothetical protein [Roseivirga pacifica]
MGEYLNYIVYVAVFIAGLAISWFIVGKWINKKRKVRLIWTLAITPVLSLCLYLIMVMIIIFAVSYYPKKKFDETGWKENIEERYIYASDIVNSELLLGKTKEEVVTILGNEYSTWNKSYASYEIGHIPGMFNIDPSFLYIELTSGIVTNVSVH